MDWTSLGGMVSLKTAFTGTYIHLWYLPYAFISGFLVYAVNRWTSKINYVAVVFTAAGIGALMLIASAVDMSAHRLMEPLPQWEFGLAAIPLGFAVGRCLMIPSRRAQRRLLLMIAVVTMAVCVALISSGFPSPAIAYGLAIVPVCLACGWQSKSNGLTAALAPLTFGVYLIHPLIAFGLKTIFSVERDHAALIALTVCISGLVTWGLMKTPLRRFV